MELQTVSTVSKKYGISTRMLRYYEEKGLIQSLRKAGYSYRVYDDAAISRLQQIIILRKLQIPLKQICIILDNPDSETVIEIFKKSIEELDSEITALSTIRKILDQFVTELEQISNLNLQLDFLNRDSVLELANSLSLVQKNIKESITMTDLNQAAEVLAKLEHARVVNLPPMTVAAYRYIGDNPRENAEKMIDEFVRNSGILQFKPDLRQLGFDHQTGDDYDGYEMLVSIPDDMEIPAPLIKKKLRGGMYVAALDINWYDYKRVYAWITDSEKYQYDGDFTRIEPPLQDIASFAGLEFNFLEQLNYYYNVQNPHLHPDDVQLEMLFPVKPYKMIEEVPTEIAESEEKCGYKAWLVTKNKLKLIGFTRIVSEEAKQSFMEELESNGWLAILKQHRKDEAPILLFHSIDYETEQVDDSTRMTFGLLESDITDLEAFMKHTPFIQRIDASKWVCFESTKGSELNTGSVHEAAQKLGYKFNCDIITGTIVAYPDSDIIEAKSDKEKTKYHWYPVR